jgi:DNA-binding NarL/FixJ family response regulator
MSDDSTGPLVLGCPGLLRDVVERLTATHRGEGTDGLAVLVSPGNDDWEVARSLGRRVILVTSAALNDEEVVAAVLAGADAVLDASAGHDEIVAALRAVARGATVISATQTRALADAARSLSQPAAPSSSLALTRREAEILSSIAGGCSVKQTARALGVTAKTVENLQSNLFRKLGARNRAQAVRRAHALGLLDR